MLFCTRNVCIDQGECTFSFEFHQSFPNGMIIFCRTVWRPPPLCILSTRRQGHSMCHQGGRASHVGSRCKAKAGPGWCCICRIICFCTIRSGTGHGRLLPEVGILSCDNINWKRGEGIESLSWYLVLLVLVRLYPKASLRALAGSVIISPTVFAARERNVHSSPYLATGRCRHEISPAIPASPAPRAKAQQRYSRECALLWSAQGESTAEGRVRRETPRIAG